MKRNLLALMILSFSASLSSDYLKEWENKAEAHKNEKISRILSLEIPSNLQEKIPGSNITWEKMFDIVEAIKNNQQHFRLNEIIQKTLAQNHLSNYGKLLLIKSIKLVSEQILQIEIFEFQSYFE